MAEEINIQNGKSIFFDDPWQYYNAMLGDIEGAKKSICVETYKFGSGNIGERFRDVLTQKAEEGVKVKILIDSWGAQVQTFLGFLHKKPSPKPPEASAYR
jgi:cardiolipin synthase